MARRLSRRPGPDHPLLFVNASDIPIPLGPPRPRATAALAPYTALLAAAETTALSDLDERSTGRTVLVGGERRPAEAMLAGDALLDDGTAVVPLVINDRAPRSLRSGLEARYLLITGTVREIDGTLAIEPVEVADLRALARDWAGQV